MAETPDPIDIAVGARVRLRRRSLGVSQDNLAKALGVSFQQVQKYERGTNRISASMLAMIAERLQTPVGWFFGEEGTGGPIVSDVLAKMLESVSGQRLIKYAGHLDASRLGVLATVARALAHAEEQED